MPEIPSNVVVCILIACGMAAPNLAPWTRSKHLVVVKHDDEGAVQDALAGSKAGNHVTVVTVPSDAKKASLQLLSDMDPDRVFKVVPVKSVVMASLKGKTPDEAFAATEEWARVKHSIILSPSEVAVTDVPDLTNFSPAVAQPLVSARREVLKGRGVVFDGLHASINGVKIGRASVRRQTDATILDITSSRTYTAGDMVYHSLNGAPISLCKKSDLCSAPLPSRTVTRMIWSAANDGELVASDLLESPVGDDPDQALARKLALTCYITEHQNSYAQEYLTRLSRIAAALPIDVIASSPVLAGYRAVYEAGPHDATSDSAFNEFVAKHLSR